MVLRLKTRESRSLPGLPVSENVIRTSLFISKSPTSREVGLLSFRIVPLLAWALTRLFPKRSISLLPERLLAASAITARFCASAGQCFALSFAPLRQIRVQAIEGGERRKPAQNRVGHRLGVAEPDVGSF